MSAQQAYRQVSARQWTRIEMLIALYEATEQSLRQGCELLRLNPTRPISAVRMRTTRLLLAVLDGIEPERDDVAHNTYRLIMFVLEQIALETHESWDKSLEIVATLASGFREIRLEANRLQSCGELPELDFAGSLNLSTG